MPTTTTKRYSSIVQQKGGRSSMSLLENFAIADTTTREASRRPRRLLVDYRVQRAEEVVDRSINFRRLPKRSLGEQIKRLEALERISSVVEERSSEFESSSLVDHRRNRSTNFCLPSRARSFDERIERRKSEIMRNRSSVSLRSDFSERKSKWSNNCSSSKERLLFQIKVPFPEQKEMMMNRGHCLRKMRQQVERIQLQKTFVV